jgi:methylase of polypeptide subunit release factors
MTIQELNDLLTQLSQQRTREKVLEFANALVDWMGIKLNDRGKPQLLAPQTQKLKDYLATAPQTVQPQLYRLAADNQNIRVRFAVLKKVKKDYINQLVDNDPGLTSYQAFVKGLTLQQSGSGFVPTQPYFIHFVTTTEYDRLVLIFNQGEQKRILTFRDRLSQTQYNRIIQLWYKIGSKPKPEIADLLWKSLDIKEVNKDFYKRVKGSFDDLVGIIKLEKLTENENQIKQFAVRLIGRYIFCWFLKEKSIIPHNLIDSAIIEKVKKFHQDFLQKLFFGTLNTRVHERDWLLLADVDIKNKFEKIPYLNGGLFDKTKEDELFAALELNSWLLNFVRVLESYDFTVDESSSQYQQVAVDPEMLGRIFENLLASQNPETEKAANNERKAFGAFYTPREIVDYMVDEALRTYLANKMNVSNDDIASAFSVNPTWPDKLNKRKLEAEKHLKSVKILDPACGSGAFPMGVLHRLISLRQLLGLYPDTHHLKKEILSNNIYGVDIMPMAVEIARLRAWLSLIVEEDYKAEKISSNFEIDALPNLDFKFMQGNSLLETYEGIKLFDGRLLVDNTVNRKAALIEKAQKRLSELQSKYIELHEANKLKGTQKAIIEKELKEGKEMLTKVTKAEEPQATYGLFHGDASTANIAEKLKELHKDLFNTSDKDVKKDIKANIEELEWNLIAANLRDLGKTDKIKDLEQLKGQNVKPYFLYRLNFPEVFTEKGGFDIVIGNPPYVRQEAIDPYYKPLYIQNHPEVGSGTADLYVYFFDSALYVTNPGGVIIFITLNKYLKTKYGEGLRKKLKDKNVDLIIDFFELPVFEASTDTAITKIINSPDTDSTKYFPIKSLDNLDLNTITKGEPLKVIKDGGEWKFVNDENNSLLSKFYENTISLDDFTGKNIYYGIKTGNNKIFIVDDIIRKEIVKTDRKSQKHLGKYVTATKISKWSIDYENEWLVTTFPNKRLDIEDFPGIKKYLSQYKKELMPKPKNYEGDWDGRKAGSYKWFETQDNVAYHDLFEKPKIIYIRTAKDHSFHLDLEGYYVNDSCYIISSDNRFLFFFLNSILFDWFKRIKFVAYGDAEEGGRVKLEYNKMITVPIKKISASQLKWFEQKYEQIKKSLGNTTKVTDLEHEVETRLFKLYELEYNEVKTVCPEFWMSEEEYGKIK